MGGDDMKNEKKKPSEQCISKPETEPLLAKPGGQSKGTWKIAKMAKEEKEDK